MNFVTFSFVSNSLRVIQLCNFCLLLKLIYFIQFVAQHTTLWELGMHLGITNGVESTGCYGRRERSCTSSDSPVVTTLEDGISPPLSVAYPVPSLELLILSPAD